MMRAMIFESAVQPRLRLCNIPVPKPEVGQVLLQVRACAICRTDLHILDGGFLLLVFLLEQANQALQDLRKGKIAGSAVLTPI